jgi:FkbM family methyltransferase
MNRNISIIDEFFSTVLYYLNKESALKQILMYRGAYKNYIDIIINSLRKKYPLTAELINGKTIMLQDKSQAYLLAQAGKKLDGYDRGIITLLFQPYPKDSKTKVKITGATLDSDIFSVLVNNSYNFLPVRDKVVIDVGANIADSCIYFALRGANRVIGLEPFPKNYELAKRNIELNELSDKVTLLLAGCSGRTGSTKVDPNRTTTVSTQLESISASGIDVPLMTIPDILNQNNIRPKGNILKMDCEGCEYESILSISEDVLHMFSNILIEYHHGYKNIKNKLEECGFIVSITRPRFSKDNVPMHFGHIYATLNK